MTLPRRVPTTPPIFIITGPSGAGKSTIADRLYRERPFPFRRFVTCTTRSKRPGERHGRDYWFLSEEEFLAKKQNGEFFEFANVYGRYYGSDKLEMNRRLKEKKPILMVLDVQGMKTVRALYPQTFVLFLDAPKKNLVDRLKKRATDPTELKRRTAEIIHEEGFRKRANVIIKNTDGHIDDTYEKVVQTLKERLIERKA